jgi:hypothetical protein
MSFDSLYFLIYYFLGWASILEFHFSATCWVQRKLWYQLLECNGKSVSIYERELKRDLNKERETKDTTRKLNCILLDLILHKLQRPIYNKNFKSLKRNPNKNKHF